MSLLGCLLSRTKRSRCPGGTDNHCQRKDELNTPAKGCLSLPGSGSVFGGWIFLHRLGGCFGVGLFSYEVVADHLHDDGDDPGARVRNKEDVEGSVIRENSEDPQDSGAYGSDYGEDHGDGGGAHASQGAGEEIHDSAEEVGDGCDGQDLEAGFDNFGVFGVDGEDRGAAEVSSAAEDASNDHREDQAVDQDFVHSFVFSHAVVLAGEAHACLGYGVDGYVEEAEDVVGCRVSCHGYGTEGVYRGLQQSI